MQVGARNHDFANLDLAEFDGAEDDFFFAGGEQAAFASLLNLDLEFFGGVSDPVAGLGIDAHGFDDGSGSAIEKFNGPAKSVQEPVKRTGDKEGDAFGAGQADGFGNEFADDYVQSGEESERGGKSEGVGQNGGAGSLNSGPERAKEICQSGFTESAESETGEGDSQLDAGDYAVQVGDKVGYDFCADVTGGDQLANAREAHRDERKFRRGKKAVERNEKEHAKEANYEHTVRIPLCSIVSAEASQLAARSSPLSAGRIHFVGFLKLSCRRP